MFCNIAQKCDIFELFKKTKNENKKKLNETKIEAEIIFFGVQHDADIYAIRRTCDLAAWHTKVFVIDGLNTCFVTLIGAQIFSSFEIDNN